MRILFIEDDAMNRRVVRDMLHVAGLPLAEADGGRAGIARLEQEPFDVLLLDLRMPEMDGFEVIDALRSRSDDLKDIPIIVVTADASPGLEDQCLAAGADAVLFKPIAMQSLFDSIAELVVDRSDPDKSLG
ncbi:MAG: response regulator [Sphingopyxis sp.]|jgi:CheY-like chemotaxis protein|nr:response regulator [Sphingopyxis sp.]